MATKKKNSTVKYPTGDSPFALPFFPHLVGVGFERFCTDLLNRHPAITLLKDGRAMERRIVEATHLLTGKPQEGADIWAKDDQGAVWIFQCKCTKSFVESKVSGAIELLEKGFPQADQYVLVTACGLELGAQKPIHARPNWHWWDAHRLTTEILRLRPRDEAIALVHQYFPESKKRLFPCSDHPLVKWKDFFHRELVEKNKHFRHTIPFVAWGNALEKLEAFAQSGRGRALILSAAGGQGKSRLLLELAQRIEKQPKAPRVRFFNPNQHGLSSEQCEVISRDEGDLLLIIDDAHRMGTVIQDVAMAAEKVKSIRLLVATRPQALEAVTSQLFQNGYAERLEEALGLPSWERGDIRKLAEQVLDPEHRHQSSVLVDLADLCPLLVVLGADLINSGQHPVALTDQQAFRERVFKSFKNDFLNLQPDANRERLNRVISFLSFVSPTRKNDALLNEIAGILGCSPLDVHDDLGSLEAAGLVAENWEGIRLYPDLFSDAVLMDACIDPRNRPSQLHKTILDKLRLSDFPALIRNIAQADWEARSRKGTSDSLFDPIWQQFITRFEGGIWHQDEGDVIEQYLKRITSLVADRSEMLDQWARVAEFLPERTFELTEMILKGAPENQRASICRYLPPLLKPIVVSHPMHAERALELLWSLDSFNPDSTARDASNAITAIAEAAAVSFSKQIEVSEQVLAWLEQKLKKSSTIERLHRQPWILSALLKPFFVREVQDVFYPGEGNTVSMSRIQRRAEKGRPLRQRALTIIETFLKSPDTLVGCAVVPVLAEAIKPIEGWHPWEVSKTDQETWRQDCLGVLKVIESTVEVCQDAPTLLLKLRGVLFSRWQIDQDSVLRGEKDRILKKFPDTLDLRVARALTSYANSEYPISTGPSAFERRMEAEQKWAEFLLATTKEAIECYHTPQQLCEFLRRAVNQLNTANENARPAELLQHLAQIAPNWCGAVLKELVGTEQPTLDRGLRAVLSGAAKYAPETYHEALEFLPTRGRPAQVCELILFLGWKQAHLGGLVQFERETILAAAKRSEESVVCDLAWLSGFPSRKEPKWAIEVLSQLQPGGERSANAIMEAVGLVVKDHASEVEAQKVAKCLRNVGEYCFPESSPNEFGLTIVAQQFPKEVYEHVRRLFELAESDTKKLRRPRTSEIPSLGRLGDVEYVDREIHALWDQALKSENGGFSREFRVALIRPLIWSDATKALDRTRSLVEACKNADEINLLAELVGPRPSRFVFDHPDVVRSILARAQELAVSDPVTKTLILAACGDTELDPEYKYILEQGDALANRFRDDPLLQPFYREIANWERHDLEWHRQRRDRE